MRNLSLVNIEKVVELPVVGGEYVRHGGQPRRPGCKLAGRWLQASRRSKWPGCRRDAVHHFGRPDGQRPRQKAIEGVSIGLHLEQGECPKRYSDFVTNRDEFCLCWDNLL